MTARTGTDNVFVRSPVAAVALYGVLVVAFCAATFVAVAQVLERRAAVAASSDLLAQLDGRRSRGAAGDSATLGAAPAGSAFLEGETVTVAGAALLQRVTGAVARVGGSVLSSQVDLQGPRFAEGYLNLIASCEIEQAALQPLLYDLESGMPFLFIEQLAAQTGQGGMDESGGRMRVLLTVSGQWQQSK